MIPFSLTKVCINAQAQKATLSLEFAPGAPTHTTPQIAAHACELRPDLPTHTCKNGHGPHFANVIENTSLPHLFEHLIIDFLVEGEAARTREFQSAQQTQPTSNRSTKPAKNTIYAGATCWENAAHTRAKIKIRLTDDLALAKAINEALKIIDQIIPAS
jgi:hypothetical protein